VSPQNKQEQEPQAQDETAETAADKVLADAGIATEPEPAQPETVEVKDDAEKEQKAQDNQAFSDAYMGFTEVITRLRDLKHDSWTIQQDQLKLWKGKDDAPTVDELQGRINELKSRYAEVGTLAEDLRIK
jgi:hypothetical protein